MNEEMEKAMNALSGGGATGGDAGSETTDWKAKYEEAQRQLNSARVDEGRVKKLSEKIKTLEGQLADATALKRAKEEVANMGEDQRGEVPEDYLVGAGVLAKKVAADAIAAQSAEFDRRMAEREQREAAAQRQSFAQRIEREFPGFLRDAVTEGGDKFAAWMKYQRFNAATITAAVNACDFDTLAWHIRSFYNSELGIPPPSGGTGAAAPDPSPTGGNPVVRTQGKAYTEDEINSLFDKKEAARDRGDWAEVKRLTDEINRAQVSAGAKQ